MRSGITLCHRLMRKNRIRIKRVYKLPAGFDELVAESVTEGCRFLVRLRSEFNSGLNRFAKRGEQLLVARIGDSIVGVCGLNRDPYTPDCGVGRVRHLYVLSKYRRRGVARALVSHVVLAADGVFKALRLRTDSNVADRFYQAMGFVRSDVDPTATHVHLGDGDEVTMVGP
ncbi:MAG: GNAT family N-acetyltransferase [Rubricoccaceae bacterium]|nr:GNAT family N-acetyltransferase [Rubricoccaceae bacterium]